MECEVAFLPMSWACFNERMLSQTREVLRLIREARNELVGLDRAVRDCAAALIKYEAQTSWVAFLTDTLPYLGVKTKDMNVPCALRGVDAYMTVEGVDGSSALARDQSYGVATQVALVVDGEVVAAYVGDVNTLEVFWFCEPLSIVAHKREGGPIVDLRQVDRSEPLAEQHALLCRVPEFIRSPLIAHFVRPFNAFVKSYQVTTGSIAIVSAQLWTGTVGLLVLSEFRPMPWDEAPWIGFTRALGLVCLRPLRPKGGRRRGLQIYEPTVHPEPYTRREMIITSPAGADRLIEAARSLWSGTPSS